MASYAKVRQEPLSQNLQSTEVLGATWQDASYAKMAGTGERRRVDLGPLFLPIPSIPARACLLPFFHMSRPWTTM